MSPRNLIDLVKAAAVCVAALVMLQAAPARAQTAFAPAAIVNEDVITYYDVVQRAAILASTGAEPGPALNSAALEQLVDDRLRMQIAEDLGISITEAQIELGLEELARRQSVDVPGMLAAFARQGVDRIAIVDLVEAQIAWNTVVSSRFGSRATPTESELDREIALASASGDVSYRLREIAIRTEGTSPEEARILLENLRNEIVSGADFAAVARANSQAASAEAGGDIGYVPAATLPGEVAASLSAVAPGGVTAPLAIPGGVALFQVLDRRSDAPAWAQPALFTLRRVSAPADARAAVTALGFENCAPVGELPEGADNALLEGVKVEALPPAARDAVATLNTGAVSRVIEREGRVAVYHVCARTGGADAAAREELREQIRVRRLTRFAEGFLQDKRRDAVIEVR